MRFTISLTKNERFQNVYKNGISSSNRFLVLLFIPNDGKKGEGQNRLGITVSKKVGKSVVRSRVTRLIREAYRLNEGMFAKGFDIVVIARAPAAIAKFSDIEYSLTRLASKSDVAAKSSRG